MFSSDGTHVTFSRLLVSAIMTISNMNKNIRKEESLQDLYGGFHLRAICVGQVRHKNGLKNGTQLTETQRIGPNPRHINSTTRCAKCCRSHFALPFVEVAPSRLKSNNRPSLFRISEERLASPSRFPLPPRICLLPRSFPSTLLRSLLSLVRLFSWFLERAPGTSFALLSRVCREHLASFRTFPSLSASTNRLIGACSTKRIPECFT